MGDDGTRSARKRPGERKDRLVQTRVPRDLEATLKDEAKRQRVSVSQLIRNLLEDAFELVDGVVTDVDQIVGDSLHLARNVRRNARRMASPDRPRKHETPDAENALAQVYAWTEVVAQRGATCSSCGASIARGERGYTGLSDDPKAARLWRCVACIDALADATDGSGLNES